MKRYMKEWIALGIQLLFFYVFPLFAGPTDAIGMVLIILLAAFFLGFVLGLLSDQEIKYFFPAAIALLFIPSVFIYYNESALVHAVWYFVVSSVGLLPAAALRRLLYRAK